jgi:hypothetical protein
MRTSTFATLGIAVICLNPTNVLAADDAATVVEKAIKAHGGAEAIGKMKVHQWDSKGSVELMGQKIRYTARYTFQQPARLRFDIKMQLGDQEIATAAATDGKSCWESTGDKVEEISGKKAEAFNHNVYTMHLSQILPLTDKAFTLSVADDEMVDDKPAAGVLVVAKGHPDVTLYFDKESSLLVKVKTQIWNEFTDRVVVQETFMKGYKDKDGRKIFGTLVIKRDGKPFIVEELTEQKAPEKLDPKFFSKP